MTQAESGCGLNIVLTSSTAAHIVSSRDTPPFCACQSRACGEAAARGRASALGVSWAVPDKTGRWRIESK